MMSQRFGPLSRDKLNESQRRLVAAHFGSQPLPAVSATVLRDEPLFDAWVPLMQFLKDGGVLPEADRELLILRTAVRCNCAYPVDRHRRRAIEAGMSTEELDRIVSGPDAVGWSPWQQTLLRAVDDLCEHHRVSDALWDQLRVRYDEPMTLEFLFVVGHYQLLAGVINSLPIATHQDAVARDDAVH